MKIDARDLRRHYESLPDEELLALHREELTEMAQPVYDEEIARRGLKKGRTTEILDESEEEDAAPFAASGETGGELDLEDGPDPDWLEDAACACSFGTQPGNANGPKAFHARQALRAAGIPSHIILSQDGPGDEGAPAQSLLMVMVPGALALHASSILDRDVFNEEHEDGWRTHLEALSDNELRALDPKIFCAGLLDRVARMKRAYEQEIARRKQ
jgi:hypothetical protein